MKTLFSIIFLVCAVVAMAQTNPFTTGQKITTVAGDTIVNTGSITKTFSATAGYSAVSVQPVVTKISGTVAGKLYLKGSIDGTNYVTLDSIVLADVATNTKIFARTGTNYVFYQITGAGTGAMSAKVVVWYLLRKYTN